MGTCCVSQRPEEDLRGQSSHSDQNGRSTQSSSKRNNAGNLFKQTSCKRPNILLFHPLFA